MELLKGFVKLSLVVLAFSPNRYSLYRIKHDIFCSKHLKSNQKEKL